eukprot:102545-Prymnesium_polylepis.2
MHQRLSGCDAHHHVVVLARVERGAVLGETGFFLGTPRSATVRAASLSVVLQLERKALDDLLNRRSAAAEREKLLVLVTACNGPHVTARHERSCSCWWAA